MNNGQYSSFCNLINFGKFSKSLDDSASTIGVLIFKTITMYMKAVTGNEKKAVSRVDAARKS